jgi:LysM repeat protein
MPNKTLRRLLWVTPALLLAAGCFQPASPNLEPTTVDLADLTAAAAPITPTMILTPFITPLPPEGFIPPTNVPETSTPETLPPTPTQIVIFDPTATPSEVIPTVVVTEAPPVLPSPTLSIILPPTPTALPTDNPCIHTVQPGEWMFAIARKYGLNPVDLIAANPGLNPDTLRPGDQIRVPNCNKSGAANPPPADPGQPATPAPADPAAIATPIQLTDRIYTVVQGDTLGAIARKFGITVQDLKRANGIQDGDFIRVGQQLKIPAPPN